MSQLDLILTLGEHDWSEEQMADFAEARVEALRRVAAGFRSATPTEARDLDAPEAQLTSVGEYVVLMREQLAELIEGDEPNFVGEVIEAVRARLDERLKQENARIVAGWAHPFEGNHCDTTFVVRLSRER